MAYEGPVWINDASDIDNRYKYNGKEQLTDHGLGWYNYGARFYDPSVGRFTTIDAFAEKYAFQSPYSYAANNPVKFLDVNGDNIGVNILNITSQEAFNAFFATDEGKEFIGQFAAKGQTINGYTYKTDGKYHSNGIDLAYSDRDFGGGKENTGAETTGGNKGGTISDGRLKLGVSINTTAGESSLIDKVTAVTHESFLHVQEYSSDYSNNK
ncbi:MAG: RHS repeat-associated core domain-containing protein [Lewinellaceae bacterium]|nr:RHS repeat-associated core domain-containing protein [Lewinellaceae bacterium]